MSTSKEALSALQHGENRFLRDRGRLGSVVLIAGISAVFVGELVLRPGERPGISVVQAANALILAAGWVALKKQERRTPICAITFVGFAATAVSIGAVGILAVDPTSPIVVLVGLSLGAAVLVPWGAGYQMAGILVTTAVTIWTLTNIQPGSRELWLQPTGSVLPTFCASVVVAYLFRRERIALLDAEAERQSRESGLRSANQQLRDEICRREQTEQKLRFALLELDHRVKNSLATLESLAEQTLESSPSSEEFVAAFRGRLHAMARIHDALANCHGRGLRVRELIELVVRPYCVHDGSISLHCDDASLSSTEARTLGTALHELATNAAKYGALSSPQGQIEIEAGLPDADGKRLRLVWRERGGPRVTEPAGYGLGTKLIESALAYESGGEVDLRFEDEGVQCSVDIPLGEDAEEGA